MPARGRSISEQELHPEMTQGFLYIKGKLKGKKKNLKKKKKERNKGGGHGVKYHKEGQYFNYTNAKNSVSK